MTATTTPGRAAPPVAALPGLDVQPPLAAQLDGPGAETSTPPPRVIGLDLSLTGTGIADSTGRIRTISSKGKADATLAQRRARLARLCHDITSDVLCAGDDRAALVVIEQPAFSRQNGHMHDRSGLWWLVVDRLAGALGFDVVEVAPTGRAKYATGKGNASKDQVLAAVVRRYPNVEVSNNNEADALVLAAMGARALGHPIDDLPLSHLAAMSAVAWPAAEGVPF